MSITVLGGLVALILVGVVAAVRIRRQRERQAGRARMRRIGQAFDEQFPEWEKRNHR